MDYSGLKPGSRIQAEADGKFYPAEVVEVSTAKKRAKAPVKVHYVGFAEDWDAWLGGDQLRSKAIKKANDAQAAGKPSTKQPGGGKAAKEAPQAAASGKADYSGLEVGARLQADFEGVYYAADVLEVSKSSKRSKAPVKVRYSGYGAEMDAWLGAEHLRSKAIKAAKAEPPKQKKGEERPPLRGHSKEEKWETDPHQKPAKEAKPDYAALKPGMRLRADYAGTLYPAEVLEVTELKKYAKAPVRVRYEGFGSNEDAWLGADKLKCKALTPPPPSPKLAAAKSKAAAPSATVAKGAHDYSELKAGTRVQAEYDGVYYAADVVQVSTGKKHAKAPVQVHFSGWEESYDSWVGADRLRTKHLKAAKAEQPAKGEKKSTAAAAVASSADGWDYSCLEKGFSLQAEYGGTWYAAEVVEVSTGKKHARAPVKVHYGGTGEDLDEWLNAERLRSKAIQKASSSPSKASPKASSAKPKAGAKVKVAAKKKQ